MHLNPNKPFGFKIFNSPKLKPANTTSKSHATQKPSHSSRDKELGEDKETRTTYEDHRKERWRAGRGLPRASHSPD